MICPKCNNDKPVSAFPEGRTFSCMQCRSYSKTAQKLNISLEDVIKFVGDETCCRICESTTGLCIDHCHDTGKVRGRLCHRCNKAIGLFEDSLIYLESAKQYLKGHSANEN